MPEVNMVWIGGVAYSPNHRVVREHYAKSCQPVGGSGNTERKCDALPALDKGPKAQRGRKARVASGITVHIIGFRSRLLDSDNFIAGAKGLRDAIARSLAVDDSDEVVQWKYHQVISDQRGTLVTMMVNDK